MDLHRLAAAITFNTPYCLVTDEQRRDAKAMNYRNLYVPAAEFFVTGEQLEHVLSRHEMEKWLTEVGLPVADTEPKSALAARLAASLSKGVA